MTRKLNLLLLIGLLGIVIAGTRFGIDYGRALWGNDQIWWTPAAMALPLEETSVHFQLYLEQESLQDHLARSSLTALGHDGMAYFVTPDLIRIRLNNWDHVKASFLHAAVYSAFFLGVSLTCLVLGLVEFFRQPKRRRGAYGRAGSITR